MAPIRWHLLIATILLAAWSPSAAAQRVIGQEQLRLITPSVQPFGALEPDAAQFARRPRRTAGTATKLGLVIGGLAGGTIAVAWGLNNGKCEAWCQLLIPVPLMIGVTAGALAGASIGLMIDTAIAADDDGPVVEPRRHRIGLVLPMRLPHP